jgi:vanadium-dependent haloperoxidase-like protein
MANDLILIWNDVALEANRVSHTDGSKEQNGPTLSSRAMAIVHLAMYDAYAGVVNDPTNLPAYLTPGPAPAGSSIQAAVGGAAFETLMALYPSQLEFFKNQLALHGDESNPGHAFGQKVGRAILKDREDDPPASQGKYRSSNGRGRHRVDPDNPGQGFHGPRYGTAKAFALKVRHALDAPPFNNGNDPEYKAALRQVRAKGGKPELTGDLPANLQNNRRTAEETLIGIFWGYDGAAGLGTPPRLYNQIVRKISIAKGTSERDNARLFAFVNAALGDAGILAWEQKYKHDFWRPVVGIREHDPSLGPIDLGQPMPAADKISKDDDPFWLPLGAPSSNSASVCVMTAQATFPFANAQFGRVKNFTPNFPAYPSGHATFGAAAFHILRLFYGVKPKDTNPDALLKGLKNSDGADLFFVSDELNDKTSDNNGTVRPLHRRKFKDGVWDMIVENALSRIFLGVHWSFDAFALKNGDPDLSRQIGGVRLGLDIAEDIYAFGNKKAPKKSAV